MYLGGSLRRMKFMASWILRNLNRAASLPVGENKVILIVDDHLTGWPLWCRIGYADQIDHPLPIHFTDLLPI